MSEMPARPSRLALFRPGLKRLFLIRARQAEPWLSAPDRLHERLPGRVGGFLSAVGWLFCRESTLLVFALTFAFVLSVFPLIVLLMSLTEALPLAGLNDTLLAALHQFFPISQQWIVRNLGLYVNHIGIHQLISVVLLAWAGSAYFFAMEAALESAYRVRLPRHFVGSQIRGTALVLALGVLVLAATALLNLVSSTAERVLPYGTNPALVFMICYYVVAGLVVFCLLLCAFHWLPNRRRPLRMILPEAVFATLLLMIADIVFRWLAPSMELETVYGPFFISVTIMMWGYTFACIIVGSARLAANGFFLKSARVYCAHEQPTTDNPDRTAI